jgi:hypothetical protein
LITNVEFKDLKKYRLPDPDPATVITNEVKRSEVICLIGDVSSFQTDCFISLRLITDDRMKRHVMLSA